MTELKQCPFCGSGELCVTYDECGDKMVYCKQCRANGGNRSTKDEAIAAWNERAESIELIVLLTRLTDVCECVYDRHDCCQAHQLHKRPCPHEVAKKLLSAQRAGK